MKAKAYLMAWGLLLTSLTQGLCQAPPPNDNFANATVLTGDNVTFTGSLANSTPEPNEVCGLPFVYLYTVLDSIWWSWTATHSGPVTLVVLSYSLDSYESDLAMA